MSDTVDYRKWAADAMPRGTTPAATRDRLARLVCKYDCMRDCRFEGGCDYWDLGPGEGLYEEFRAAHTELIDAILAEQSAIEQEN